MCKNPFSRAKNPVGFCCGFSLSFCPLYHISTHFVKSFCKIVRLRPFGKICFPSCTDKFLAQNPLFFAGGYGIIVLEIDLFGKATVWIPANPKTGMKSKKNCSCAKRNCYEPFWKRVPSRRRNLKKVLATSAGKWAFPKNLIERIHKFEKRIVFQTSFVPFKA